MNLYNISGIVPQYDHKGILVHNLPMQLIRIGENRFPENVYRSHCTNYDTLSNDNKKYLISFLEECFTDVEIEVLEHSGLFDDYVNIEKALVQTMTISQHELPSTSGVISNVPFPVSAMPIGGTSDLIICSGKGYFDIGMYYDTYNQLRDI